MVRAREGTAVRVRVRRSLPALCAGALLLFGGMRVGADAMPAVVPAPGVYPHEIVVGSLLDLSGPLGAEGIAIKNGLTFAFDEINAHGGVLGRRIRLVVKDTRYNPVKAREGARALLDGGLFAMIGSNGTPPVSASMDMVLQAGVLHLFPFVPSHTAYMAPQPLAFTVELPVAAQLEVGVKALLDQRGPLRVGVLYRADSFGHAALKGVARELARRGLTIARAETYAPDTTDFSPQLARLREAGVELVVMGAVAQESFNAVAQARRADWHPVFLCPSACYVPEAAALGGRALDGLYSVATVPIPYPDVRDRALRDWVARYEHQFATIASAQAFSAYLDARLFAEALRRAGPHPTPLHFARVLEAMPPWTDAVYGGVPVDYTAGDHMGLHAGVLAQIAGGRWQLKSGPLSVPTP